MIGCSTAFALAERGARVALLEAGSQPGTGATSRSSACIRTHYSVTPNAVMANHAIDFFQSFGHRLGDPTADAGFEQCGLLLVADDSLAGTMTSNIDQMRGLGIETETITRTAAQKLHPLVQTDDATAFGWEPNSGFADPHLTTSSFARAAKRLGATTVYNCKVTGLEVAGGALTGVTTAQHGRFTAPITISCLNIWSQPTLGAWLGEELPVVAERHCLISLRAAGAPQRRPCGAILPMVKDLIQPAQPYFRPSSAGAELLVGDNHPDHRRLEADPDHWDETVDTDQVVFCAEIAQARFPCYAEAAITSSWSGLYDVSPDFNPVLGRWPSLPGLSVAFGFSGHGFKLAPIVGQMLADDALGLPELDNRCGIAQYSPGRFAAGKPLTGVYEGAAS